MVVGLVVQLVGRLVERDIVNSVVGLAGLLDVLLVVLLIVRRQVSLRSISFFHRIDRSFRTDHFTTLDYSIFVLEAESSWHMFQTSNFFIYYFFDVVEVKIGEGVDLISEIDIEGCVLINSFPDIINHFFLLFHVNSFVKSVGVGGGHENHVVIYEVIGGEIW